MHVCLLTNYVYFYHVYIQRCLIEINYALCHKVCSCHKTKLHRNLSKLISFTHMLQEANILSLQTVCYREHIEGSEIQKILADLLTKYQYLIKLIIWKCLN